MRDKRNDSNTFIRVDCPCFGLIKMCVASVNRKICVGQCTTCAVKRVTVSVFAGLKTVGKDFIQISIIQYAVETKNVTNF